MIKYVTLFGPIFGSIITVTSTTLNHVFHDCSVWIEQKRYFRCKLLEGLFSEIINILGHIFSFLVIKSDPGLRLTWNWHHSMRNFEPDPFMRSRRSRNGQNKHKTAFSNKKLIFVEVGPYTHTQALSQARPWAGPKALIMGIGRE